MTAASSDDHADGERRLRPGPEKDSAAAGGALSLAQRFLTLREGSIIVVTLIAFIYFATSANRFFTGSSIKSLLPYFAPFAIMAAGEVFVMINGEIDLSIGAMYLFTPFIFYKLSQRGPPADPGDDRRAAGGDAASGCSTASSWRSSGSRRS